MDYLTDLREKMQDIISGFTETFTQMTVSLNETLKKMNESIDWEYLEELESSQRECVIKMAQHGWTLSPNMQIGDHMIVKHLSRIEEIDEALTNLYFDSEYSIYPNDISYIQSTIDERYKLLVDQCIFNFETGNHIIAIPSLLLVVEGLCAGSINAQDTGRRLVRKYKSTLKDDKFITEAAKLSVCTLIDKYLLSYKDFDGERPKGLNRNWVLHGRDDVREWKRVDALKLINNLAGILFVSERE